MMLRIGKINGVITGDANQSLIIDNVLWQNPVVILNVFNAPQLAAEVNEVQCIAGKDIPGRSGLAIKKTTINSAADFYISTC